MKNSRPVSETRGIGHKETNRFPIPSKERDTSHSLSKNAPAAQIVRRPTRYSIKGALAPTTTMQTPGYLTVPVLTRQRKDKDYHSKADKHCRERQAP